MYIYHYYDRDLGPFKNISELPDEEAAFIKIDIDEFDKNTIYFTYDEIPEIIEKYGYPQEWNHEILLKARSVDMSQITKRALEQSLKNLLLKKPLNKITISDIAEDCGINRMTFYYHFQDIYDLVEWSCLEDARKALEEKKTHDTWQQGFIQIFKAVQENKPFIMNVYHCVDREQVEKYLKPLTDNLLMGVIDEESVDMKVREEDKKFIARVYSYSFIGLMLDWIKDDMKETPEKIVHRFALVIQDSLKMALDRFKI